MAIKNYTTEIDVYRGLGEIQGALAAHGVSKIMVEYDGGTTLFEAYQSGRLALGSGANS